MDAGAIVIIAVNATLALGCGWPLAVLISRLQGRPGSRFATFGVLLAVYVGEAAAFTASMGTDVLSVGLAVVWGLVLGRWLPNSRVPARDWRRIVRLIAIYTVLPVASFLSVPVVCALNGWPVLDAQAGTRFGVPGFLPWPLNTILGLCVLVAGVGVVAKIAVTMTLAGVLIRRGGSAGAETLGERDT